MWPRFRRRRIFFFQAEDGIRVWSVTGVQTCALPIYPLGVAILVDKPVIIADPERGTARDLKEVRDHVLRQRSEERRVGKESRSRRAPDQQKQTSGRRRRRLGIGRGSPTLVG